MSSGQGSIETKVVLSSRTGKAVIAAGVLGSALAYMSDDMLNVAIPTMSADLNVGFTDMQFVVNGYFITMLALMLTAGSIGDIRGHRQMFLGGLAVFSIGAVVCATAPAVWVLVAGRAVQGVGAAFLLASGLALVNGSFADGERGRAVGLYMGLTAVSTAAGPVLGGLIVDVLSWRAIFVAPLVFPLLAALVTFLAVPEAPRQGQRRPDGRGSGLAFATIAAFSFALIRGPLDWTEPEVLGAMALTFAFGSLFFAWQRRSEDPMLPLAIFRNRVFAGGNGVTLISFMVTAGVFFFVVVQLQSTLDYEPAVAGAVMVPLYFVMVIGSPLSGKLADRIGARLPVVVGLVLMSTGTWWLGEIQAGTRYLTGILPPLLLFSVGLALLGAPLTTATLGAVKDDLQGVASGINNTAGQLAGLLMIAVLPAVAGLSGIDFDDPSFATGFSAAMRICAVLSLVAVAVALFTMPFRREPGRSAPQVISNLS